MAPDFGDHIQGVVRIWLDAQREIGEAWLRAFSPDWASSAGGGPGGARATSGADAAPAGEDAGMGNAAAGEGRRTTNEQPGPQPTATFAESYRAMLRMWEQLVTGLVPPGPGLEGFGHLYGDAFDNLAAPWFEALRPPDQHLSKTKGERSALSQFTDLYWDAYERTMGRLLESPDVGYRREFDQRLLQSARAWIEFRSASFDYLAVLGRAWVEIVGEMMSELDSMGRQGKKVTSFVELLQLWTEVADRVLIEIFRREEYAKAQGRLLNASMAYRREERRTADAFLKMTHVPSQSDLDEVAREVHLLRREVRELRKSARESEAELRDLRKRSSPTKAQSPARSRPARSRTKAPSKPAAREKKSAQPAVEGDGPKAPAQSPKSDKSNGIE